MPADEVHVWHLGADERTGGSIAAERLLPLLSDEERARHARFVFERDRDRFLLAHAALRLILARYRGVSPGEVSFATNQYGRPEIDGPRSLRGLRFNLSHTQGLIAVAVCAARDVGVDVEWHARHTTDLQSLADRFFSPVEARALGAIASARRVDRFFDYWTLKESYIKACGMGLAIPLDRFSFHLDRAAPRIEIDPTLGDDAPAWRFFLARPTGEHTLSAAVRAGRGDMRFVLSALSIATLVDSTSDV